MLFHNNFITRLAVLLLLLGVVMAIGTPHVSAHSQSPHNSGNMNVDFGSPTNAKLVAEIQKVLINPQDPSMPWDPAWSIRHTEFNTLTELILDGRALAAGSKVTSLTGLDHANVLTKLVVRNHKITDVARLLSTTSTHTYLDSNLTHLDLSNNELADISGLANLTELKYLNLSGNKLKDTITITGTPGDENNPPVETLPSLADSALYPLRNLTNLETLILSRNQIASVAALKDLPNLRQVALQDNRISDFSPLVRNSGLGAGDTVWVGGNPIGSAFFSTPYGTSESATLIGRGVTLYGTLGKIAGIPDPGLRTLLIDALTRFVIGGDLTVDLGGVDALYVSDQITRAFEINFKRVKAAIRNEPLTESILSQIRLLNASSDVGEGYWIESLEGLQHCSNLETLIVNDQFLTEADWPIIGQLTSLKALSLSNVFLVPAIEGDPPVLNFLENLTALTRLDLSENEIVDLSPLVKLTQLEALDLRHNEIEFIPIDFRNLRNLEILYLDDNGLEARSPLGDEPDYLPSEGYYDPPPDDANYFMGGVLQELANQSLRFCDIPIIKSIAYEEPEFAYGQGGLVHITVTFNSDVGYISSKAAFRNGRPYLALSLGGNIPLDAERNPFHTADWIEDGSAVQYWITHPDRRREPPINPLTGKPFIRPLTDPSGNPLRDSDGNQVLGNPFDYFGDLSEPLPHEQVAILGDTLEFGYFLPPGIPASSIRVEYLAASPLTHYGPEISLSTPRISLVEQRDEEGESVYKPYESIQPSQHKAWRLGRSWFRFLDEPTKPVLTESPTVVLRRADGETGTVTDDFDVEIVFSGPLSEGSAAVLANQISLTDADGEEVAGVSIGSLTRSGGRSTTYQPETWTLSVSVLGANGDVLVTLDPEGLIDVVTPGNPVATAGSTLSVTVPVSTPPAVTPRADPYVFGEALEMSILFAEDGVMYEGAVPPYITIYLGERVPANERHATWARAEDTDSTRVTFTYQIGAGDFAESVSIKSEAGVVVPRGATVVLGDERIVGNAPPPAASGQAPSAAQPASGGLPVAGDSPRGGGTERTVISLGTPSARVTATEIPVRIIGTVGTVYLPPDTETRDAVASNVPRTPIVFNELGNGSGDTNDWLEFRNVTGDAVSLKDWTLSVVQDDKKEDTSLIAFSDVSVPANGLLLIVHTSPGETLLARGDDIADADEKHGGSAQPYLVNAGLSLPDDGKFLLILRNAKEKLGKNEAFVDVAGGGGSDTDAFVRNQEGDYDTYVWPLQVGEAPGGNTEEALGSGKVWQRAKADIVGYHKDAWAEAAFTGLGYDRAVTKSAATAGTPGYPNGAVKTASATPKGSITFSEIMVDSGGGTLPQWIELYNRSKTEAININRWELEIQNVNSEDLVGRPIVTLTLQEKLIQPNQTLLIVSGDARASSSARLPADRVYNLFKLHEKNLRLKKPHDTFLSAEGFYLKLTDASEQVIDEIGNTDGDRRTKDAPYWALSMSAEEGMRSSLIRRYTEGMSEAKDGMLRASWVLAANLGKNFRGSEELHWGHADDIGSPGYRKGGPLPVELSSFSVKRTEKGAVVLSWTTESEVDNAGFNLRRSEKRESGFTLINPALIAGAGTTGERQTYTFTDASARPGIEYYYQIEEVSFGGKPQTLVTRLLPGPVSASNRALTTFGELKRRE